MLPNILMLIACVSIFAAAQIAVRLIGRDS
jgi:hypothetical protein